MTTAGTVRIAVDAMGGDRAPGAIVEGVIEARKAYGARMVVVGLPEAVQPLLRNHPGLDFVGASEVIEVDDPPLESVRAKRGASINVCARLARQGDVDAWVSAGNSGAVMAAALLLQGRLRGVERPALGAVFPTLAGGAVYYLDVGINVDCSPALLCQFARMGAVYAREILGRDRPRIALLSNGSEPGKGDWLRREAYARLQQTGVNFIGNIEGPEIFTGKADVVVTDGFLGNVAAKMAEGTAEFLFQVLREEIPRTWTGKLAGLLVRPRVQQIRARFDWREHGGAPLLGINGVVVVAHGRSDARAIASAIRAARDAVTGALVARIQDSLLDQSTTEGPRATQENSPVSQ